MKTLKRIDAVGNYARVEDKVVSDYLKGGWVFCPKTEWKKNVRDINKQKIEIKATPKKEKRVVVVDPIVNPTVDELEKIMKEEERITTKNKQPKKGKRA
jgi:hypothetical protein